MLSHDDLGNHYKNNFALVQHHKYSLTEIEQMIPFERTIFLDMLQEFLDKIEETNNT
jgi:hypothetical protein